MLTFNLNKKLKIVIVPVNFTFVKPSHFTFSLMFIPMLDCDV